MATQTRDDDNDAELRSLVDWIEEQFDGPAAYRDALERETAAWLTWDDLDLYEHLYDLHRLCEQVGMEATSFEVAEWLWERVLGPKIRLAVGPDSCGEEEVLLTEVAYRLTYEACRAAVMARRSGPDAGVARGGPSGTPCRAATLFAYRPPWEPGRG